MRLDDLDVEFGRQGASRVAHELHEQCDAEAGVGRDE